jgi:hypothetical protein
MLNILDKLAPPSIFKKYKTRYFSDVIKYFEEKEIKFVHISNLASSPKNTKHVMQVFYKETLIYQTIECDSDKNCLTMATKYVFDNLDTKILIQIIDKI